MRASLPARQREPQGKRLTVAVLVAPPTQAAPRSELVAEAIPEALKNMVLMLHAKVCEAPGDPGRLVA